MASVRYLLWEAADALNRHKLPVALVVVAAVAVIVYLSLFHSVVAIPSAFGASAPSYMYCAGSNFTMGSPAVMEYAKLSSAGIGEWASAGRMPINTTLVSCAANNNYLYCIEGHNKSATPVNNTQSAVYYARISNASSLAWSATASYGVGFPSSCVAHLSYIYCRVMKRPISINSVSSATPPIPSVVAANSVGASSTAAPQYWEYARLTPGGITNWTSRPILLKLVRGACTVSNTSVYCIGGYNYNPALPLKNQTIIPTRASYSAPFNSSGAVGRFVSTTGYPIGVFGESCVTSRGYIYCIGGYSNTIISSSQKGALAGTSPISSAYYASFSNGTIGTWKQTNNYPVDALGLHCVSSNSYVYCTGGFEALTGNISINSSYYAPLSNEGIGSWTKTNSPNLKGFGNSCVVVQ